MKTTADRILAYIADINYAGPLPDGIRIMNPFRDNPAVIDIARQFYHKYYNDIHPRTLILGINPGRFGGGVTGIPFTDTKRLEDACGIPYIGKATYEPSATFVHEVLNAYGGLELFYSRFYINSVCPLGFTRLLPGGKEINYNYYDSAALTACMEPFIVENIHKQIVLGMKTDVCFCLGMGKNEQFLRKLNEQHRFFGRIVGLPHPRFVMQYRAKTKQDYINQYLEAFR